MRAIAGAEGDAKPQYAMDNATRPRRRREAGAKPLVVMETPHAQRLPDMLARPWRARRPPPRDAAHPACARRQNRRNPATARRAGICSSDAVDQRRPGTERVRTTPIGQPGAMTD